MIEIKKIIDKRRYLDLLLLADEQEDMIYKYLDRGNMFGLFDDNILRTICVVTQEDSDTCELKNIATYTKYQELGYGSKLVEHILDYYRDKFKVILVGTGDSEKTLRFYESCGFSISHHYENFFIDNYDRPIFENGKQLVDMVYFFYKFN